MSRLTIYQKKSNFMLDGKPFFYLGDTVWSAFTTVTLEEWAYYLAKRKAQGFTVLQINTLPQWDRCMSDVETYPFPTKDGYQFDFSSWNEEYFQRARTMCRMAVAHGFQLALVVLWMNYVPGTWGSKMVDVNVMPEGFVKTYTKKVVQEFEEFQPIYIVSGDTAFESEESVAYYQTALDVLCEKSPDSLKTLHLKRGYDVIPVEFLDRIDFYMFQSGHNSKEQKMAYVLPDNIRKKYPKKPMINAEPCYEQTGYSRNEYGRFRAEDVRKAAWQSLLSGACAGVAYGAHGIWNWHKTDSPKNPVTGEIFEEAFPWQEALEFPGAWDYGFIKNILEENHVQELVPANDRLGNETEEIRMAVTEDGAYFIYVQFSTSIRILKSLQGYEVKAVDLEEKRIASVGMDVTETASTVKMHPFPKDALLIIRTC